MQRAILMLGLVRVLVVGLVPVLAVMAASPVVLRAQDGGPPLDASESPFDAQAAETVSDIASGRFAEVRTLFDPTMSDLLSEPGLANAWRTYQELLGAFQSAGQPSTAMQGDLAVTQVPVQLAHGEGEIRMIFHPDGTLAGLFFRCAEGVRC